MNKCLLAPVVMCLLAALHAPSVSYADKVPDEVLSAAQAGLQILVKSIPINRLPRFGFLTEQDIADAIVGQGFQSFVVVPDRLLNDEEGDADLNSLLVPLNNWQFLIMTHGKAAAILTVYLDNGKWLPASLGAAEAASELNALITTWPVASGHRYRLIHAYKRMADFVELSTGDDVKGLIPMTSARYSMNEEKRDFDPSDVRNTADIATKIKADARKNNEARKKERSAK